MSDQKVFPLPVEKRIVRAALRGGLRSSSVIDSFCSWLLAVGGGSAALLVSNVDSVSRSIPARTLGWALTSFLIAFVLGAAEKLAASVVAAGSGIADAVEHEIAVAVEDGEAGNPEVTIDFPVAIEEFHGSLWPLWRWFAKRGTARGAQDPLTTLKSLTHCLHIQQVLFVLTVVAFLVSASILICGLGL